MAGLRRIILLVQCALAMETAVVAQVRTWVSTSGVDNATCDRANPCRSFAAAITAVNTGGEVVVLDSGGYGPVTINKSVSILSPQGIHAAIAPTIGNAITVDAVGRRVVLRGLYLNGQGATTGVLVNNAAMVDLIGCTMTNFEGSGFDALPGGSAHIFILDSLASHNGQDGFRFNSLSGYSYCSVNGSQAIANGGDGFRAIQRTKVMISKSVASYNLSSGFKVSNSGEAVETEMIADSCIASHNIAGFDVLVTNPSFGTLYVARSTASNNFAGFRQSGTGFFGVLAGTNLVAGNTNDKVGSIVATPGDTNP